MFSGTDQSWLVSRKKPEGSHKICKKWPRGLTNNPKGSTDFKYWQTHEALQVTTSLLLTKPDNLQSMIVMVASSD